MPYTLFFSTGLLNKCAVVLLNCINRPSVEGKWGFWDIDLGNFRKFGTRFFVLILAEKPKNKRKKYKFFTKNKNRKLIFFIKKLGQEIKIRIKPYKTG